MNGGSLVNEDILAELGDFISSDLIQTVCPSLVKLGSDLHDEVVLTNFLYLLLWDVRKGLMRVELMWILP